MMEKFKGIFPALLTPFDKNDNVNKDVLRRITEYNLQKGVDGFYVDGSTAEAFLLSEKERLEVLETVSDVAKGKATLIAHIGCISTKQAIELAKEAKEMREVTELAKAIAEHKSDPKEVAEAIAEYLNKNNQTNKD